MWLFSFKTKNETNLLAPSVGGILIFFLGGKNRLFLDHFSVSHFIHISAGPDNKIKKNWIYQTDASFIWNFPWIFFFGCTGTNRCIMMTMTCDYTQQGCFTPSHTHEHFIWRRHLPPSIDTFIRLIFSSRKYFIERLLLRWGGATTNTRLILIHRASMRCQQFDYSTGGSRRNAWGGWLVWIIAASPPPHHHRQLKKKINWP